MGLKDTVIDLMPGPLVRTFAAPYIAGKGVASGVAKADELHGKLGLYSTVDLLGEEVFRREDVEAMVQLYFSMIEALKGRSYASISLKPTQLGITDSEAYCQDNLRRIVAAAAVHGMHVTLDMEDRHYTDATLRMFRPIREDFGNFGIVLQSRLYRTPDDIKMLHAKPCKVRICIGIYNDLGNQLGLMISPQLYRKYVKEKQRQYIRMVKGFGAKVFYHACGSITEILEDFIEIGVEILDPLQLNAMKLTPSQLAARVGGRMTLHGGLSMQDLLVHGSPEDVRAAARDDNV